MLLALFLACSQSAPAPPSPQRLALDPSVALGVATDACLALPDPADAGRCAVDAMELRYAVTEARCERLPDSLWRDECFFVAAEIAGRSLAGRYALCSRAGVFARDCRFHLWQLDLMALRKPTEQDPQLVDKAQAVHDRHAEHARPTDPDYDTRFWAWFWRDWWRAPPGLQASRCHSLEGAAAQQRCLDSLPAAQRALGAADQP